MPTFADKPKAAQQPAGLAKARSMHSGLCRDMHPILQLQRKIGNQAVQRLLWTDSESLEVGSSTTATACFAHDFSRTPLYATTPAEIQPKLTVNTPGDTYEQEADRISEQVMRMPETQLQRACACAGGCPKCRKEQGGHEQLQTKRVQAHDTGDITAPLIVQEVTSSPGQPLDPTTRGFVEPRFGHDFSQVRVHTGPRADNAARAVQARAFTLGYNIVFGAGQYAPNTADGRRLLAHELTHVLQQHRATPQLLGHELPHVLQQAQGRVQATRQAKGVAVNDDQTLEREADELGARAARGDRGVGVRPSAARVSPQEAVIQRSPSFDECTPAQERLVQASHDRAGDMLGNAVVKLMAYNGTTPPVVRTALATHFHTTSRIFAAWAAGRYLQIGMQSRSPQYECESATPGRGWTLWCTPFSDIELRSDWFADPDIDMRARTMIHEWFHRYGCHLDLGYQHSEGYGSHGTMRAIMNADSWAWFAVDVR